MSEYITFVEVADTGKTKIFEVRSTSSGASLGMVKWYGPWRQYIFCPAVTTVWNIDCLQAVTEFIKRLMAERVRKTCAAVHIYTTKEDTALMKCERCEKPYQEMDAGPPVDPALRSVERRIG